MPTPLRIGASRRTGGSATVVIVGAYESVLEVAILGKLALEPLLIMGGSTVVATE